MRQSFDIEGMSCSSCAARVHSTTAAVSGVAEVTVNLLKKSMVVEYEGDESVVGQIVEALKRAGYQATPQAGSRVVSDAESLAFASANRSETADDQKAPVPVRLIVSFILAFILLYVAFAPVLSWWLPAALCGDEQVMARAFVQLLLCAIILVLNRRFFVSGFAACLKRSPNMDSLVALGSGISFIYSFVEVCISASLLGQGEVSAALSHTSRLYFDSAAMILVLVSLGKFFEERAKTRAVSSLTSLLKRAPSRACRMTSDGKEEIVSVDELKVGDVIVVRRGETVPADGVVREGSGLVDESALTGEPIPRDVVDEDRVLGASINLSGYFTMTVKKTFDDMEFSQIARLVDEATSTKAPIERAADKVAAVFVPLVLGIAAFVFVIWAFVVRADLASALNYALSVLVISCPCALGLATPTAVMVGMGRGAKEGILFKSSQALQQAQSAKTVVFDKTGTITQGKPSVEKVIVLPGCNKDEFLKAVYALEKPSEHPIAQAICTYCAQRAIPRDSVSEFEAIVGGGLQARYHKELLLAGNERLMRERGIDISALRDEASALADEGATPLYFARSQQLLGLVAIVDPLKESSASAFLELHRMDLDTLILTGDNKRTALAIQKQVNARFVVCEALPTQKDEKISELASAGGVVMVGDGINDAPALARADVGIALHSGSDIALESADVILLRQEPIFVVSALQLSRSTMRIIKQNLFWAFFYNVICIPIAAGVLVPFGIALNPMIAAAAMSASSLCVVLNALRLSRWKAVFEHAAEAG